MIPSLTLQIELQQQLSSFSRIEEILRNFFKETWGNFPIFPNKDPVYDCLRYASKQKPLTTRFPISLRNAKIDLLTILKKNSIERYLFTL